jgi:DnaJ-class molecular chaperone
VEDPYEVLGVPRDATPDDIRRAYRKLAKQHHPDLNPGNAEAEARFKTVSVANELLSDPIERGRFDRGEIDAAGQERPPEPSYRDFAESEAGRRYSRAGAEAGGWRDEDFADIFGRMFNEDARPGGGRPRRGQDAHYALSAGFLDTVNGSKTRLTLPDGRTLDVRIPAGTAEGQVLRLRGQGGKGIAGGPDGDALIEVHVLPHPFFERDGQNIRIELPVTVTEAVLGGTIEVPTPGGRVRMTIPPHSDSGTELRLLGRGVPAHGGQAKGNLLAKLRVVIGTPDAALETFLGTWTPEHKADPRHAMEAGR